MPARTPTAFTRSLLQTALALQGAPYRNGGADPSGFDCSGFIWYVFEVNGLSLPRTVSDLYQAGTAVAGSDVTAGDVLFFRTSGRRATHVALALGNGRFIHAPSVRGVVRTEPLGSTYWSSRYLGARRFSVGGPSPTPPAGVP
jgi:cell wall-associated NlpC family hydrolase